MTDLEKAIFYIVGFVDGNFAAIGLRDDDTTEEDTLDVDEGKRLNAAMRRRIRKQFPSLSDEDIETAYNEASMNSIAYIPSPAKRAEIRAKYPEAIETLKEKGIDQF
ncbi:hypothetical protein GOL30_18695 [Sinorhizobium medicae]|uniref:hypothetical protein n=1 Tax=Sinorhizobium medicae TaxID=110321 RepID=UPI00041C4501|nr:hypothetical protein [Sinorhizobium medicae]MDX0431148.1 hypothetical protein [Sinorhizobium medicae]MDX0442313.1 hypothetical protein [Sinorhizobium medicae]MDX0463845.1 hypothetical protein [Sinorhizobium medicae]MDX0537642.1 hypothetical protein [Sinorhizobium medicae]MDX0572413.1 hypothetical protein [Sinorhizobium medicae]